MRYSEDGSPPPPPWYDCVLGLQAEIACHAQYKTPYDAGQASGGSDQHTSDKHAVDVVHDPETPRRGSPTREGAAKQSTRKAHAGARG
jgi:hypothetical protein